MFLIAEVVDTKKAFKPKQKDDEGNEIALGSIQIRILPGPGYGGPTNIVHARPAVFNRRIPLIGEHVLVSAAPVNSEYDQFIKGSHLVYYDPINILDDLTINMIPKSWKRKGSANTGKDSKGPNDQEKPGYTFPDNPKKVSNIQPYEGDDIIEGRLGQSLRFTSTVEGDLSIYSQKPWWKQGSKGDPLAIIRVAKPTQSGDHRYKTVDGKWKSKSDYTVEDPDVDQASIYFTSTQSLPKIKAGFEKNKEAKKIGAYAGGQVVVHSDRVVLNAKKDIIMVIGKTQAIITSNKVSFQSASHNVDLDDLMTYIKDLTKLCTNLASAKAKYATPAGPTGPATNVSQFTKHLSSTFSKKFKKA